jgi:hypothetical protein
VNFSNAFAMLTANSFVWSGVNTSNIDMFEETRSRMFQANSSSAALPSSSDGWCAFDEKETLRVLWLVAPEKGACGDTVCIL